MSGHEEVIIQTVDLRHEYGDVVALKEVNLSVPQGAVVALVGPNGAGKTTLLKVIAALLEPTGGTVRVKGFDVRESPREIHTLIGFLPDFFGLYEELSVKEYLDYFGRAYRLGSDERSKVMRQVLEQVGLLDKVESRIEALSRGMRQRLAIARTLIHNPPVLLLDEPSAGLDPQGRQELQLLFRQLAQMGKTLIVSSHILTELEDYCTHVAILQQGLLIASGGAEQVRNSLKQGRQIRIQVCSGSDSLESALSGDPKVQQLKREERGWEFSFSGTEAELAELLRRLVASGISVTYFGEERRTIQDTYLSLTEHKPS